MLKYYPINLDLKNQNCVVVGAGRVAERKAARLLECGAKVSVVGLKVSHRLAALAKNKKIVLKKRNVVVGDLSKAHLVISATDDRKINSLIHSFCLKKGILVNVVDSPKQCNFTLPSLFCRGDLTVSISTAGLCPALAKKIRLELGKKFGPEYAVFLRMMKTLRPKAMKSIKSPELRKAFFTKASSQKILALIKKRDFARAKQTLERLLLSKND